MCTPPETAAGSAQPVGLDERAARFCGVALLFRCMALLQIDPDELATDDPLLFRELQGLCSVCGRKKQCADDLARGFDEIIRETWRSYCPNAATLETIGAVQNCALAAQHLKMPRSTGKLEPG